MTDSKKQKPTKVELEPKGGYSPYSDKELESVKAALTRFVQTVSQLRNPDGGCPWDVKQTHESLRSFMIEEAYEAAEAMAGQDAKHIAEELGDVLLQVVLNAQVAKDQGKFSLTEVIDDVNDKMVERHPHVFDPEQTLLAVENADDVKTQWEMIKNKGSGEEAEQGVTYAKKMAKMRYPATHHSLKIGKTAAKADFDWANVSEVLEVFKGEVKELEDELNRPTRDMVAVHSEISDLYFCLAQICRHIKADPELIAAEGNQKFLRRFVEMEKQLKAHYAVDDIKNIPVDEKEQFWQKAKLATES